MTTKNKYLIASTVEAVGYSIVGVLATVIGLGIGTVFSDVSEELSAVPTTDTVQTVQASDSVVSPLGTSFTFAVDNDTRTIELVDNTPAVYPSYEFKVA